MTTERVLSIEAKHFSAGIVVGPDEKVIEAAPIVHYMIGWTEEKAVNYARRKGWRIKSAMPAPDQ